MWDPLEMVVLLVEEEISFFFILSAELDEPTCKNFFLFFFSFRLNKIDFHWFISLQSFFFLSTHGNKLIDALFVFQSVVRYLQLITFWRKWIQCRMEEELISHRYFQIFEFLSKVCYFENMFSYAFHSIKFHWSELYEKITRTLLHWQQGTPLHWHALECLPSHIES